MYGIFAYIYHKNQPHVGKYTSPMDPMGYKFCQNHRVILPKHWHFFLSPNSLAQPFPETAGDFQREPRTTTEKELFHSMALRHFFGNKKTCWESRSNFFNMKISYQNRLDKNEYTSVPLCQKNIYK